MRRVLILIAACAGALLVAPAPLAHADGVLIDATPSAVTVAVPGPGHSEDWVMQVRNVSSKPVSLSLAVAGSNSALFSGGSPLTVSVADGQKSIFNAVAAGALVGTNTSLPELAAGGTYTLHGSVALPRDAGNAYQSLSGTLTFRFVAEAAGVGSNPPDLAYTGASVAGAVGVGLVLVILGGALLSARRRAQ